MCCLFGMMDVNGQFSKKQKAQIIHALAAASEARGTDAAGIAYNAGGKLHVYKRPLPGHLLRFHIPDCTRAVMGHTRLTTQGDQKRNYNNHPFKARAGGLSFALAHNGVIHNDIQLRRTENLPRTRIETDSYAAVQLLEQSVQLTFDSLKRMAERMEGSFTFTILDGKDNLYFVKGDNPMCIFYFPEAGAYFYASTEEILTDALCRLPYRMGEAQHIKISCGEILRIDSKGKRSWKKFSCDSLFYPCSIRHVPVFRPDGGYGKEAEEEYLRELKSVAGWYGFSPGYIDSLLADKFTIDDVEEMLYAGEL